MSGSTSQIKKAKKYCQSGPTFTRRLLVNICLPGVPEYTEDPQTTFLTYPNHCTAQKLPGRFRHTGLQPYVWSLATQLLLRCAKEAISVSSIHEAIACFWSEPPPSPHFSSPFVDSTGFLDVISMDPNPQSLCLTLPKNNLLCEEKVGE